jgi:maltose O-acetyltransferase
MKIDGNVKIVQQITSLGKGSISIERNSNLGCYPSPCFKRGEFYLEARHIEARIKIGNDVFIKNNCTLITNKSIINIGDNTLIGLDFFCIDSDFHPLNPLKRLSSNYQCKPVIIGRNVFIGAKVTVLKGVSIADNSIIAAGSVISRGVGDNVIYSALH